MITLIDILTNYVGVRKEYLLLEQAEKDKLVTEFMEITPVLHKESPLDTESIDLFLSDQSPENIKKMGEAVRDNDMRDLLGQCERFYIKVANNIIGPEFIPHRSTFTELADKRGYELKWDVSSFLLYKKGLRHVVKFVFDRHTVTLQCAMYNQNDEEVRKLSALLAEMKEMIFATGAYNVEVNLSNETITPEDLDRLV